MSAPAKVAAFTLVLALLFGGAAVSGDLIVPARESSAAVAFSQAVKR